MLRKINIIGLWLVCLAISLPCIAWAEPKLDWDAVEGDVLGYRIYYSSTQGDYTEFVDAGNVTQYPLLNLPLTEGMTYYLVVRVYNDNTESPNSNEVSWTVPDNTPPMAPSGVSCQNGGSRLSWQANSEGDLEGYRVYHGTASGSYEPFVPVGKVTEYTFQGLTEGNTYYFALSAVDLSGNESGFSGEVSSTITDTQSPVVAITSPTSGTSYSTENASINIGGTASDNIGVNRVAWRSSTGGSGSATGTATWTASNIALTAGANIITISAEDTVGNKGEKTLTVTYTPPDTAGPVVNITSPTTGGTYSTSSPAVTISGTASDSSGVNNLTWTNSRGGNGLASGTVNWSMTNISLADGTNTITITAFDTKGNSSTKTLNVVYTPPDTTSPVVGISSPSATGTYATESATINLEGSASDNQAVTEVRWSNARGGSDTASGTSSWVITDVSLAEGENEITVTARDAAGNTGTDRLTVTFTGVDVTDPLVTITSPQSQGVFQTTNSTVTLSGSASDISGIERVTWANTRGGDGTASGTDNWSTGAVSLADGENVLTVAALDTKGNSASQTLTVVYSAVDTTDPAIEITSPTGSGTYEVSTPRVDLAGNASDNVGLTKVMWQNSRGGGYGTASGKSSWSAGNIALAEGENEITVGAFDAAGNIGKAYISVTYTPSSDSTPPEVLITEPVSGGSTYETANGNVDLSGNSFDNVGVEEVTWKNSRGGSGTASGTVNWSIDDIDLAEGENLITVTAEDGAGNFTAQSITVNYNPGDTTGPTIARTRPTSWGYFFTRRKAIRIAGTAADTSGVTRVEWSNSAGGSGTAMGTLQWRIDNVPLTGGWNVISITATDAEGNTTTDRLNVICWSF